MASPRTPRYRNNGEPNSPTTIVAGVDFGNPERPVSIFDHQRGRLATAAADCPLHRKRDDPDYAMQSHDDQMQGLVRATRGAIAEAGISGTSIEAIALDATGSRQIAALATKGQA